MLRLHGSFYRTHSVSREPTASDALPTAGMARQTHDPPGRHNHGTNCRPEYLLLNLHREGVIMSNTTIVARVPALAILTLALAVPLLAACNTTAGAGQDISATGHAVSKAATSATP
jgi:predicted small secreted protein